MLLIWAAPTGTKLLSKRVKPSWKLLELLICLHLQSLLSAELRLKIYFHEPQLTRKYSSLRDKRECDYKRDNLILYVVFNAIVELKAPHPPLTCRLPALGRCVVTHMLTTRGTIYAELTISCTAPDIYFVVTGSGSEIHDLR